MTASSGFADVENDFPVDFAIFDLKKFLACIALFKDPDVEFGEKAAIVKSGDSEIRFTYAAPKLVLTPKEKVAEIPWVIEFDLAGAALDAIMKAAKTMGLEHVSFVGKDGKLNLVSKDPKSDTSNTFAINLGTTTKTFNFDFVVDNLKIIPGSYRVKLAKAKIACFEAKNLTYYITTEASSKYES